MPAARPNSAGPQPGQSFSAWALVEQESKGGSPVGPDAVQSEPVSPSNAPATQSDTQLTAEGQSPLPQLDIAMPEEPTSMASSDQIDAEHGVGFPERSPTAIGLSTVATIQLGAATDGHASWRARATGRTIFNWRRFKRPIDGPVTVSRYARAAAPPWRCFACCGRCVLCASAP